MITLPSVDHNVMATHTHTIHRESKNSNPDHEFKDEEKLMVFPNNLLQLDNVGVIHFTEGLQE